jgi:hypothetical protein
MGRRHAAALTVGWPVMLTIALIALILLLRLPADSEQDVESPAPIIDLT